MEGDEESQDPGGVSQPALEQEASQQQSKWREEGRGRGGSLLKLYSRPQLLKGPLNAHGCPM